MLSLVISWTMPLRFGSVWIEAKSWREIAAMGHTPLRCRVGLLLLHLMQANTGLHHNSRSDGGGGGGLGPRRGGRVHRPGRFVLQALGDELGRRELAGVHDRRAGRGSAAGR